MSYFALPVNTTSKLNYNVKSPAMFLTRQDILPATYLLVHGRGQVKFMVSIAV